ncbi:MAG TPA: NADH-quinone oxidoreductase subunit NuoH [Candidatus Thermoplasmatota archaeon]|nr:NADH-quinone oxidoreductase subunit NuoH [Candidatus Thermoplasmatota archaeon]
MAEASVVTDSVEDHVTVGDGIAQLAEAVGLPLGLGYFLAWSILAFALVGFVLGVGGIMSYVMRKFMARVQSRIGPNRVGPYGLLQFLADGIKLMSKEDITPLKADRWLFRMAPFLVILPIILSFAPIPFGPGILVADLRVGLLFILAVGAVAPVGEIVAAWASNNKYSMMGGLRAAALDVAYGVPLVLAAVGVVILTSALVPGSGLNTLNIVEAQRQSVWFILLQPLGAFIFFAAALAKAGIVPMDLPEAESELVAGYFTEYSGMRFGVFFVGVFVNIVFVSMMTVLLFFGGWHLPFVEEVVTGVLGASYWTPVVLGILGLGIFLGKTSFFVLFVLLTWFTLPRLRIDQFLAVSWKALFPLAVLSLVLAVAEAYVLSGGI